MVVIPFQEIIFSSASNLWFFFVCAFAILGGGIKYIDDAFDENTFSKKKAMLLAPFLGVFWAYTMSLDPAAATILAAVLLSVFVSGKIDNNAFWLGLIVTILLAFYLGGLVNFLWLPLIALTIAGFLDEMGNNFVGKKPKMNNLVQYFFEYRFIMKIVVFVFALFRFFDWVFFAAFIAFDIVCEIVTLYSKKLKPIEKVICCGSIMTVVV